MAESVLSRRHFLGSGVAVGAALVLGVDLKTADIAAATPTVRAAFAPDAFIRIASDGKARLIMPQTEMGQGIYTALSMLIAEELDLPLDGVTLEAAPANDKLYGNPIFQVQATGGSTSMRGYWLPLRKVGASARAMLVAAAARRWRVAPESCRTEAGAVIHDASGRTLGYGMLAASAMLEKPPAEPKLKEPADFRLIGRSHHRLDTPDKANGVVQYGIDAMPPGVRFASLACSPVLGGRVARVDELQAKSLPGVKQIVVLEDMVAVVGDTSWAAMRALAALDIIWNDGPLAAVSTETIRADLHAAANTEGHVAVDTGARAKLSGDGVISAAYELPLLAHAPMEPMNCTVHLTPGHCEVWVGTQAITMAQRAAAEEAGLTPEQVTVHNHLIGGGFGRRLEVDGVRKAVRIARHVDGPVKVIWSREEDIGKAPYRSVYGAWLEAKLDNGKPVAWSHKVVGPAVIGRWLPPAYDGKIDIDAVDGAAETPYDFPASYVEWVRHEPRGVNTAFWRGVGPNMNVFATESFIDRVAHEAGADPLAFRRSIIGKLPRARAVLDLAATKAGWGDPLPTRSGRGISLQYAFGSFLCTIAEVSVADDGAVTVTRLTTAVDCGTPVNPDGIVSQIQGGMIFGLSAALHGEITLVGGRTQQSNFHDYRVVRMDETPRIDVHVVTNAEAPGGIGEPGTVSVQGAVANAIYAATGVQLTRMPIDTALLAKDRRA
ncbi:xanthine dehydrogenase family protein molybdopterin-binding subunit [Sphingomonas oligoaromativorans]|uniref:xanthine dehydrogenase family protein molybdopterin-binding subunit n=1 Tax=Sphingomonas oligoaromativorans TaxID=575322 RepID=UPI00141F9E9A|nr:molybdopterin cofactor-binding domain-containing protein [Sphingomonas oligoaromativorans]NIJ35221.1 isoquinoline 1-oxidoreductase beta subunit [Sphingomonas oligoaromativorans]